MRRVLLALLVAALFAAVLVLTFPADRVVQLALRRLPPELAARVEVGPARLTLGGITVAEVTLRGGATDRTWSLGIGPVTVRPSLLGLLTGRRGMPLAVRADGCDGHMALVLDRADGRDVARVSATDLDLAICAVPLFTGDPIDGRASGEARLALADGTASGAGTLTLTDAHWHPSGVPRHAPLDAEHALVRWTLAGERLRVEELTLANRELAASGTGTILLQPDGTAPIVDLLLGVRPLPAMPQAHHDLLARLPGSPPDAEGARTYRIRGPLDAPLLGAP